MIYTANAQKPVAGKGFQEKFTYLLSEGVHAQKLTLNVRSEVVEATGALLNAPVIVQVTESEQHVFENESLTEQFLEIGFWSKAFVTPITGWRIRVADGFALPGLVDMVAYG